MKSDARKKMKKFGCLIGLVVGIIYILNPTFGIFEIIPDNLPYIGNLDEASAVLLIIACLKELRKKDKSNEDDLSKIDD